MASFVLPQCNEKQRVVVKSTSKTKNEKGKKKSKGGEKSPDKASKQDGQFISG